MSKTIDDLVIKLDDLTELSRVGLTGVPYHTNGVLDSVLEVITDYQFDSLDLEKLMVVARKDGIDYKIPLIKLVENVLIKIYKNNLED